MPLCSLHWLAKRCNADKERVNRSWGLSCEDRGERQLRSCCCVVRWSQEQHLSIQETHFWRNPLLIVWKCINTIWLKESRWKLCLQLVLEYFDHKVVGLLWVYARTGWVLLRELGRWHFWSLEALASAQSADRNKFSNVLGALDLWLLYLRL